MGYDAMYFFCFWGAFNLVIVLMREQNIKDKTNIGWDTNNL